ncbi:Ger(x)C family spore germination protein [Paenibacillus sp. SI8]|uniref:Ger(x)C family spore germination protein n=1 Tax=unclassified Paenibacillus TaxID=185978 RepID=UPI0034664702
MKAKVFLLTVMFAGGVLLTGCWNNRELKDLGFVMAMGVDQVPKTKEYRISLQIVNPGEIAGGTLGGGGGGKALSVSIITETGSTLSEAIRKTAKKTSRQPLFSHMRLIVLGEEFAKDGVQDLLDFFERNHEPRDITNLLVARGDTAEQLISIITPLEKIPANSVMNKLMHSVKLWSESLKVEIDDVSNILVSEGKELTLSGVEIVGNPQEGEKKSNNEQSNPPAFIQIRGIALFKDGKLSRWMDDKEARGVVLILNKAKSTIENIGCGEKKEAIGIEVLRSKSGIKVKVKDEEPIIDINIRQEGDLSEVNCPINLSDPNELAKLEMAWSEETKKEILAAVKAAQSEKSDIFGFGEAINRQEKKVWMKIKKDWKKDLFANSQVHVNVESFIRHSGMRTIPYLLKGQKEKK